MEITKENYLNVFETIIQESQEQLNRVKGVINAESEKKKQDFIDMLQSIWNVALDIDVERIPVKEFEPKFIEMTFDDFEMPRELNDEQREMFQKFLKKVFNNPKR